MPQVSFAADIKPLFRAIDVSHMKRFGLELDDYTYMSNATNANSVLANLSPHNGEPPSMPPGGPCWTAPGSRCSPSARRTATSRKLCPGQQRRVAKERGEEHVRYFCFSREKFTWVLSHEAFPVDVARQM
jgi:hypothetical protein